LEEKSICRVLDCFLGVGDRNDLEEGFLVDKATGDEFVLFWEVIAGLEVKVFPYFQE